MFIRSCEDVDHLTKPQASKRRLEVLSIRVAIKLCLYSGLKMDRASRAFSVETVDEDNRGLKIGRVSSCLLFFEVFDYDTLYTQDALSRLGTVFTSLPRRGGANAMTQPCC